MNLRRQLILVSLLLLSLPWAGCQFIREMEGALRHGQEQSLQATAQAVAAVTGEQRELLYPDSARLDSPPDTRPSLYAVPATGRISVDGYADGWEEVDALHFQDTSLSMPLSASAKAVTRNGNLYLLITVQDPEVIYHNPGLSPEPNGDRLILRTWQQGQRQEYVVATAAPGSVRARAAGRRKRGADPGRIRGYWQDARGGYSLELEIPLSYTGERLGFYLVNNSARAGTPFETLGNISPLESTAPPWLIYSPSRLQSSLAPFSNQGREIRVTDNKQWLIGDIRGKASGQSGSDTFWLIRVLYRSILADDGLPLPPTSPELGKLHPDEIAAALAGQPTNLRYQDAEYSTRTVLAASAPIFNDGKVIGAVVVSQSGEQYLSLTDQAFSRLLGYSMLAIAIGAFGLLGYASLLSLRIGRLSKAASEVIAPDGSIANTFPRSTAADEIGELSRRYADLLDQLREYNNYLRTLSRKLTHELRTPVAVIQTSLENLECSTPDQQESTVYLGRAREGLKRLNGILTAMSEANRLEESIRGNQLQEMDIVPLLTEVFAAYRDIYTRHQLQLSIDPAEARTQAVPELIVQALDKLMENAASFTPAGAAITIALHRTGEFWALSVSNEGSSLPQSLQDKLFDPMVSLRDGDSDTVHLGLGLHVARLICDYHGGTIRAENSPGASGVVFTMTLPVT